MNSINECILIELDKNHLLKGNITVVENMKEVPFIVNRVYFLYDIPGGECRGGHAHKKLKQLVVAASGYFEVLIDDGKEKRTISLSRPNQALLIVPGIWRELKNFSSGSICLVLASEKYNETDYIRDYTAFQTFTDI